MRGRDRVASILKYFGVKPEHLRQSRRSRLLQDRKDKSLQTLAPGDEEDEFYSMTILAMLLCICKGLQPRVESSGDKPDHDSRGAHLALLRGLLQWPLRHTPSWGTSIDGMDFLIEDGELDLKLLREEGAGREKLSRFLFFWSSTHHLV